ncbi:Anoctamin-7 [Trichoplax sp. H2]|nr:Anoctamin-7 [Trichoplax sp. H2]|eukprot:RDD44260.1 Anoctamin-7 [Trichoplax sp. H2]
MKFKKLFKKKKKNPEESTINATTDDETDDLSIQQEAGQQAITINMTEPEVTPEYEYKHPTLYFTDGKRKIDFVIAYEKVVGQKSNPAHEKFRRRYIKNIISHGLAIEEAQKHSDKSTIMFYKVHIPWPIFSKHAEELLCRVKLQTNQEIRRQWSERQLRRFCCPNIMKQRLPYEPKYYVTTQYAESKIQKFIGHRDPETMFTSAERSRVAYHILANMPYGSKRRGEIGIDRLEQEGIFTAGYPLHDGNYKNIYTEEVDLQKNPLPREDYYNARNILRKYWGRFSIWYKYQPIENIRLYFGEKVAIYFAWLGFYTAWLLPAATMGFLVFIYSILTMNQNPIAHQVCNEGKHMVMCPRCPVKAGCKYWNLSNACGKTKLAYIVDNPSTVFYSVFICFWAVFFLEFWKRKEVTLAHQWDTLGFEEEEERPRAQFSAFAPSKRNNPITDEVEPYMPPSTRLPRYLTGVTVLLVMLCMVVICLIAVLVYRAGISLLLHSVKGLGSMASMIASISGTVINLILIMLLSTFYTKLAVKLTDWELHRTQTEYEDQLTFKVFCFQFANFYGSIFYIAFFKGRFDGYPGHYNKVFGVRLASCGTAGCLPELSQQLAIIMIGKQMIGNAKEFLIPIVKNYLRKRKVSKNKKAKEKAINSSASRKRSEHKPLIGASAKANSNDSLVPRWEEDYTLEPDEPLFGEYLEMIIQYGFTTIFVVAFPLAPFFALLNNWLEIRLDASKYVTQSRRPVAYKAEDIGVWFTILNVVTRIAVLCNAFIIAFTSEFMPKLLYQYTVDPSLEGYLNYTLSWAPEGTTERPCRYRGYRDHEGKLTFFYWKLTAIRLAFVVAFEHFVFATSVLIDILVPDIPESLQIKIKREEYLAKKALEEKDELPPALVNNNDEPDGATGGKDADVKDIKFYYFFMPPIGLGDRKRSKGF